MKWKNLSIGKKLGIGFGSVLFLLIVIGGYGYKGIDIIGKMIGKTGKLTENNQFMLLKTIDHLKWVSTLSDLVFVDDVVSVKLETDEHNCDFGKWLYSNEMEQMAVGNTELNLLLDKVKDPHQNLHQSAIKILDTYVPFDPTIDIVLAERWIDHLSWIKALSQSLLTGQSFEGTLDPNKCAFGKWYASYNALDPTLQSLLQSWQVPHTKLHTSAKEIVDYLDHQDLSAAKSLYQQQTIPALEAMSDKYKKTMDYIDKAVHKQMAVKEIYYNETLPALQQTQSIIDLIREQFRKESNIAMGHLTGNMDKVSSSTVFLSTIAIVVGILFSVFIAQSIAKSTGKGVAFADALSTGDMTSSLDIDQNDEVGLLAKALNRMVTNLREMFKNINGGVATLIASSTELSAVSQQMATGAEQSAEKSHIVTTASEEMKVNMQAVSTAMEQTSTNVQMMASAVEQMAQTISEIASVTENGRKIASTAVDQAKLTSNQMGDLGQAVEEIGKVTETIADISEQTNLLALNATIEAARAGEAGKGFSVVANEIKELAKQTAEATKKIGAQISNIQLKTGDTVGRIDQISEIIHEMTDIISMVASSMEEQAVATRDVSGHVNQAAQGIEKVTLKVAETTNVSSSIAKDMAEVNQTAREIAAGSTQVNGSARNLSALADQLNLMASKFNFTVD